MAATSMKQKTKDIYSYIRNSSWVGIVYAVLSTILFTYAYFAAQQVVHSTVNFPILELVFVRCFVQAFLLIPIVVIFKRQILFERERWWDLLWLTLSGYWCLVSGYWALHYIPASILLPISATCPLFAIVFSYFILKEKCFTFDGVCGLFGFVGILLISHPTFIFGNFGTHKTKPAAVKEVRYLVGCLIALLFGAGKALLITLIRKWARDSKEDHPDQIPTIIYPSLFGVAITPMLMLISGDVFVLPSTGYTRFALFAASIISLIGSYCIACAMHTQTSPVVGLIRNLDIVWIFLLQYAILNIRPSFWSITGAVFVVLATILVVFRKDVCFKCYKDDYEEVKTEEEEIENGKECEEESALKNKSHE